MNGYSQPGAAQARAEYEAGTEGLRGFCALVVLYTHLLAPKHDLDGGYAPSSVFWLLEAGQGAVLLFFVLSGYVIGLTNSRPMSRAAVADYAWRRAIRILPLYFLAVGLSVVVRPIDSWQTILGNLLFLQNEIPLGWFHVPLLESNTNLWSLNYEALYYLIFLLIWAAPRFWPFWMGGSFAVALTFWRVPQVGPAVATYAAGWVFWLAGYALARVPRGLEPSRALPWPSLTLLWLATWHLKPLWWMAHRFELLPTEGAWMNFTYCDFIPVCVALLMASSGRRPRAAARLALLALAIPLAFTAWQVARGRGFETNSGVYQVLVCAAGLLWFWRPPTHWIASLAPIGAISYGLYVFQRPVQWFVLDHAPLPSGTAATFVLRAAVAILITFVVSYLGESVLQPRIRRLFRRRHVHSTIAETPRVLTRDRT